MNELDFRDRFVFVVGGSSGIGNGIARVFRDHGARVCVGGTRPSAADYGHEEGSELSNMDFVQLDLVNANSLEKIQLPFEDLDVMVCSQGTVLYQRAEFEMRGFRQVVEVNLMSVMACCMRFHSMLQRRRGSAILVGSAGGGHKATIANPAYSASKGGLRLLTMTLAAAWGAEGIRVNSIAPGLVETKLTKITRDSEQRFSESLKKIPLGRWGTPEEMGRIALFLASPLASYITGQTLIADGGKILV